LPFISRPSSKGASTLYPNTTEVTLGGAGFATGA
jgi:hypothetical protein